MITVNMLQLLTIFSFNFFMHVLNRTTGDAGEVPKIMEESQPSSLVS